MVIAALEERARDSEIGDFERGVNYYDTLLALHLRRSDFRGAAQCAYECAERLEVAGSTIAQSAAVLRGDGTAQGSETDDVYAKICARRERYLLRATTALAMAPPDSRWVTGAGDSGAYVFGFFFLPLCIFYISTL
jgi:alkylhydroperoxidase family enzyme